MPWIDACRISAVRCHDALHCSHAYAYPQLPVFTSAPTPTTLPGDITDALQSPNSLTPAHLSHSISQPRWSQPRCRTCFHLSTPSDCLLCASTASPYPPIASLESGMTPLGEPAGCADPEFGEAAWTPLLVPLGYFGVLGGAGLTFTASLLHRWHQLISNCMSARRF